MNEVMMVPVQEFNRLQDYYKGQITQSALLNKAGRLAAEEHIILNDSRIPDSMAVKMTKPIANEEIKLVKRKRTGTRGTPSYQGTAEPESTNSPQPPLSSNNNPLHLPHQVLKRSLKLPNHPQARSHPFCPNQPR